MTDEELALSYVAGNKRAFDLLLSRNQSKLFSYIVFVVKDRNVADDIFQETFLKAITRLQENRYEPSGKFSSWLMRIAHNAIMDWYRDTRTERIIEPTADNDLSNLSGNDLLVGNIENYYVNEQVLKDVRRLMYCLPTPQREVVFMRFYQQLSFKEIAETTNVSINTALGRMRYAILNLRKMARDKCLQLQLA